MGIVAVNDLMYLAVLQRQLGRFPGQVTMVLDGFVCVCGGEKVRSLESYALPAVAMHRSNPQKVPVHSPAPVANFPPAAAASRTDTRALGPASAPPAPPAPAASDPSTARS